MDRNVATMTLVLVMTLTVLACIGVTHYLIDLALYVIMKIIVKMPLRYENQAICLRTSDQVRGLNLNQRLGCSLTMQNYTITTTCIQDALKNVVHTSTAVIAHDTNGWLVMSSILN